MAAVNFTWRRARFLSFEFPGAQVAIFEFSLGWGGASVRVINHGLNSGSGPGLCFAGRGKMFGVALERGYAGLGTNGCALAPFAARKISLVSLTSYHGGLISA